MAAHSDDFPWPSHYGHFRFFEGRMKAHDAVAQLEATGNGTYQLTKSDGDRIRVFICECYSYGVAEYYETIDQIGNVDVVIINSNWCGYTGDAKQHCQEQEVGLFSISEFMGAIRRKDFWNYTPPNN